MNWKCIYNSVWMSGVIVLIICGLCYADSAKFKVKPDKKGVTITTEVMLDDGAKVTTEKDWDVKELQLRKDQLEGTRDMIQGQLDEINQALTLVQQAIDELNK